MEYLGIIIAIVGTGLTWVAAMVAMFLWVRGEANADRRDLYGRLLEIEKKK